MEAVENNLAAQETMAAMDNTTELDSSSDMAGGAGDDIERDSSSINSSSTNEEQVGLGLGRHRQPIGPNDTISVQGRYLVYDQDPTRRFSVQGLAFPITPSTKAAYDEAGWMRVLDQIAATTDVNTVRIYNMNCSVAAVQENLYQGFLQHAAQLGIYVMVPLTSATGAGVLERTKLAPKCYNPHLYAYGTRCLDMFLPHPNVLAGLVGNEVMNAVKTWPSAPCIKAYAADLKRYMKNSSERKKKNAGTVATTSIRILPLAYAAQHDSITAQMTADESMKLTLDYLTCRPQEEEEEVGSSSGIDVFGINVESWCSSLQTFHYNEDGLTETAYYRLWQEMYNASVALMFTEMGCSKMLFDRDNGLQRDKSAPVRDWAQVPVVLHEMVDVFSGFCAYAYSGNPLFNMMGGVNGSGVGVWNGHDILTPSRDFNNFAQQLHAAQQYTLPRIDSTSTTPVPRLSCHEAIQNLENACGRDCTFIPFLKLPMPSYYNKNPIRNFFIQMSADYGAAWDMSVSLVGVVLALVIMMTSWKCCAAAMRERKKNADYQQVPSSSATSGAGYHDDGKQSPQSYGTYESISVDSAENGNYNNHGNGNNNGNDYGKVHAQVY